MFFVEIENIYGPKNESENNKWIKIEIKNTTMVEHEYAKISNKIL